MTDFNELIPEMRAWNNGDGIDVETWIGCSGNFRLAIGYSIIFWPRFREFEGYVFREGFSVESLRGFERQSGRDRRSVESVMNHLHLDSIQHLSCEDISRERLVYLGRILKEIYEVKLIWQFPNRKFEVHFHDPGNDTLSDYVLTFFQTGNAI